MSLSEPERAKIINNYETRNLNKAAYLILKGATYVSCKFELGNPIAILILNGVNTRHRDHFWTDDLIIEYWTFMRKRHWLKNKIEESRETDKTSENNENHLQTD
jgi:hypothetical protein